jgi:hypothetical protein
MYATSLLTKLVSENFKLLKQQTLERIVFITEQLIQKNVLTSKDIYSCLLQQVSVCKTDE